RRDLDPGDYLPACVEACPTGAIQFGDLNDPASAAARGARQDGRFRLLEQLRTDPKIYYRSKKEWVRKLAAAPGGKEGVRG
ncbi:MAG TPA: hypothetical protein VJ732_00740, partial [Bryobacteraceae bacterium]|nr:hypothetical protein [Bryobacteraceae bacterium]